MQMIKSTALAFYSSDNPLLFFTWWYWQSKLCTAAWHVSFWFENASATTIQRISFSLSYGHNLRHRPYRSDLSTFHRTRFAYLFFSTLAIGAIFAYDLWVWPKWSTKYIFNNYNVLL